MARDLPRHFIRRRILKKERKTKTLYQQLSHKESALYVVDATVLRALFR